MKHRRIYSSLNKDRLRTAADRSRARHLSKLMDAQEREEQDYYNESTYSYNRSRIFRFSSDIEAYINNFVDELNADIKSTIKEYELWDVGIWQYIDMYLRGLEDRGSIYGISYSVTYDNYYGGASACLGDYRDVFAIATYTGSNNGDPNDYYFKGESIHTRDILECIYTMYIKRNKIYDENKFYKSVIEIIDSLLDPISYAIDEAIEDCLMDNPPPLG